MITIVSKCCDAPRGPECSCEAEELAGARAFAQLARGDTHFAAFEAEMEDVQSSFELSGEARDRVAYAVGERLRALGD